ncbi:unnamed protein product [Gordionus sp. m RMFG-2023]
MKFVLIYWLSIWTCQYIAIVSPKFRFYPFEQRSQNVLTPYEVYKAIQDAENQVNEMEKTVLKDILKIDEKDSVILNSSPYTFRKIRLGYISSIATDTLGSLLNGQFNKYQLAGYLNSFPLNSTTIGRGCPYTFEIFKRRICNLMYREIDGFCNNLKNPIWGSAISPPIRFIPPDYGDGLNSLRLSFDGSDLPNPRIISTAILPTRTVEDPTFTNMVMVYGQFMDHEFALTSSPTGFKLGKLKCCNTNITHPQCLPVHLPPDDHFFGRLNQNCMEVVRSLPVISRECRLGFRQQNNEATSYIDGSQIYGSINLVANGLREFEYGLLKTQFNPSNPSGQNLLPVGNNPASEQCANKTGRFRCFAAGDERTNENSLLIASHTLFMREHNRVVRNLERINPHWDDERLYQEGRRIIAAFIQHITFKEFVPVIINPGDIKRFNLELADSGYFSGYNEDIDATIDQGFAVAAFRFGHSLINKDMFRISRNNDYQSPLHLKTDFFRPENIYDEKFPKGMDPLVRGIFQQHIQLMDNNIAEDVKNHLFEEDHVPFGMDLMVLNLMRGREHGVPGYNEWRQFCGFTRFEDFYSMEEEMFPGAAERFSNVYKHPDDIDLFPAGVSELPTNNIGILGPTFSCIVGLQFHNMRFGDRFWYENFPKLGIIDNPFKPEQLQEIRKITLSKITCTNTDTITTIQRNVFRQPSLNNPVVNCGEIPDINFKLWKENIHK